MSFYEVRFPAGVSMGAAGGPGRKTDVVTLGSGFEQRNARWANSLRKYDAGYGVKNADDLHAVIEFFEAMRGRAHGFRWKDWADYKSCAPLKTPTAADQTLGTGDGAAAAFQLVKNYGGAVNAWSRKIAKPVRGTVTVAVAGAARLEGVDFTVDYATGAVTFQPGHIPAAGQVVSAGYEFDVPARFDTDDLQVNLQSIVHGSIPHIPVVEIRL